MLLIKVNYPTNGIGQAYPESSAYSAISAIGLGVSFNEQCHLRHYLLSVALDITDSMSTLTQHAAGGDLQALWRTERHKHERTMRQLLFLVALASAWSATVGVLADEPVGSAKKPASGAEDREADADRKRRGDFLKAELDRYTIVAVDRPEAPLKATAQPVLRYTNPVRTSFSDGAAYLWLDGERPLAAAILSIRDKGNVVREFVSFTERPLLCRRERQVAWTPKGGNLVEQSLSDAPPPDASDKRRLRQMRAIAARFRVIKKSSPDVDLRLLNQPVYRYAATSDGVIDGAVFALVEATDPDFLLVVEAHRADAASPAEWRYTLARMLSGPVIVEIDGKPLWSAGGYWDGPRSPSEPYVEIPFGVYQP